MNPLVTELIPAPEPWDVARSLAHWPHLLFLDSADRHPERGRYSYVMADPTRPSVDPAHVNWAVRAEPYPGIPPFQGGYAGLFGYEFGQRFERIPAARGDDFHLPDHRLYRYDWVISWDHLQNRAWFVSHGGPRSLDDILSPIASERAAAPVAHPPSLADVSFPIPQLPGVWSNFTREGYLQAVRRVIDYIHAGDGFQVNLSQRLLTPLTEHPLALYGRLRACSPAPFACYFDAGEFQVVSASPERFLQLSSQGEVITRPIKGTRPRGLTPAEDADLRDDLMHHPKDRAENVMIVDLLRNDLGRVCEYGSVTVPRVCEVETYNYVHHLVSEVRGTLRPGLTAWDLLRAAFPGGSVTGAPKVRAMEIIAELEPTVRGPYCGSIGCIGFNGSMDTNILIRTFTAARGWLQFPVGGGIVADSDPVREYEETLHKAAGLLRALQK
ncbi:MAG: aminodeoxychorismate synthase component I [Bacteroidales bacterium]|nr:aminodeoxychorismate synthase component I [Bacteroidales bacterium]